MKEKRALIVILLITILIDIFGAAAYPNYTDEVSGLLSNCILCHEHPDGSGLNSYGKDFGDHNNSIEEIAELDSDADGFTNNKELEADTFPGDPESYPGNEWAPGFSGITLILGVLGFWILHKRK